jgi:hypothetical protein
MEECPMATVTGYYNTPPAPSPYAVPAAPVAVSAVPTAPGQQPISTTDTWVQTSNSDPYVAGMRTSGSALAAMRGAKSVATMARWNTMLAARSTAAKGASAAARAAGRKVGTMAKMTKQMQAAKSIGAKAELTKGINAGVGGAVRQSFFSLGNIARSIGSSALFAVPMSLITNFLDWKAGKINEEQRNTLIVADAIGYTATGAGASLVGGAIGSTFLGPGVGTVLGIAAGFGFGWVYEKFIRPTWGQMVHNAMYATPAPVPTPTPTPTPPPVPTPEPFDPTQVK